MALRDGSEPSRTKWEERVGAAVEKAVKEKVKEKFEGRGIESERE